MNDGLKQEDIALLLEKSKEQTRHSLLSATGFGVVLVLVTLFLRLDRISTFFYIGIFGYGFLTSAKRYMAYLLIETTLEKLTDKED